MEFRRTAQIVFQDPGSSLNPYQDVRSILSLPLKVHKVVPPNQIDEKIAEILNMVELPADFMYKSPNSIGGGERQLVSIARALCCNPKFIILDEPTSSLDVSIQAKILNMLMKLRDVYVHHTRHGRDAQHFYTRGNHVSWQVVRSCADGDLLFQPPASLYADAAVSNSCHFG